jgi:hypothetical protein
VIRTAGVADRDGRHAQVLEGPEPLPEKRPHRVVALQVYATDLSAAVIQLR